MSKFKVGDLVRFNKTAGEVSAPDAGWYREHKDQIATVTREENGSKISLVTVRWQGEEGTIGYFSKRFELVSSPLTDEELAAKYREHRSEAYRLFNELKVRGYTCAASGSLITDKYGPEVEIWKYIEEEVVVTQKKQVKKEL